MSVDKEATELLYEKLITMTDDDNACKLARRALRACKHYLKSVDLSEDNIPIFCTKLYALITKLNSDTVTDIIEEKIRFKDLILADIYSINQDLQNARIHLTNKMIPVDANSCSIYRCPRCKERKHTYKEVQKRALDEPSSAVCVCLVCDFRFVIG